MMSSGQLITLLVVLGLVVSPAKSSGQSYRVVTIDPWPGIVDLDLEDIDNSSRGVGTFNDGVRVRPFVWDLSGGFHPLGTVDVPIERCWFKCMSVRINNSGQIGLVRSMANNYWNATAFRFTSIDGAEYQEFPLPWGASIHGVRLTDSGILLAFGGRGGGGPRLFAFYQSQVYDLSNLGEVQTVGEDGTVGGTDRNGRPFLRFSDGQLLQPWPGDGEVTVIGPGGHFAGRGSGLLYYAKRGGPIGTVPLPADAVGGFAFDINRGGDVVGAFRVGATVSNWFGESHGFVYRGGQLIDLNDVVSVPEHHIASARAINDHGVIIASLTRAGQTAPDRDVILIPVPREPAAPTTVDFSVSNQTVTLWWPPVADAVEYIVEAGGAPGASDLYSASIGHDLSVSATVPAGRYYVRVHARNAAGRGDASPELVIDVGSPPTAPPAPADLTWSIPSPGTVQLAWAPVSNATDYVVEAGSASGLTNLFNGSVGNNTVVSAQVPAGRYYVRVRARNTVSSGVPSEEVIVDIR
jgi:hypothetical protein